MDFTGSPEKSSVAPDGLECGMCLEEYQESGDRAPHQLPCGHSACLCCIHQVCARNKLCPFDKSHIGAGPFPKNLALAGMLHQLKRLASSASAPTLAVAAGVTLTLEQFRLVEREKREEAVRVARERRATKELLEKKQQEEDEARFAQQKALIEGRHAQRAAELRAEVSASEMAVTWAEEEANKFEALLCEVRQRGKDAGERLRSAKASLKKIDKEKAAELSVALVALGLDATMSVPPPDSGECVCASCGCICKSKGKLQRHLEANLVCSTSYRRARSLEGK